MGTAAAEPAGSEQPCGLRELELKENEAVTARESKVHTEFARTAVRIFAVNDRLNQILIEHLDAATWNAQPPGKVRSIAAIFTHMHNVRTKWIRLTAPRLGVPPQLNRAHCTPRQARAALARSADRCGKMLAETLNISQGGEGSRVRKFLKDGWSRPWPAGPEMLCYMISHEAHHRGQICMLAHQLGFRLPGKVTSALWRWDELWK
jgi:uncharacterized damage-inducible protein DinB